MGTRSFVDKRMSVIGGPFCPKESGQRGSLGQAGGAGTRLPTTRGPSHRGNLATLAPPLRRTSLSVSRTILDSSQPRTEAVGHVHRRDSIPEREASCGPFHPPRPLPEQKGTAGPPPTRKRPWKDRRITCSLREISPADQGRGDSTQKRCQHPGPPERWQDPEVWEVDAL